MNGGLHTGLNHRLTRLFLGALVCLAACGESGKSSIGGQGGLGTGSGEAQLPGMGSPVPKRAFPGPFQALE